MHRLSAAAATMILGVGCVSCSSSEDSPKAEARADQTSKHSSATAQSSSPPAPTRTSDGLPVAPQPENTLEEANVANEKQCVDDGSQSVERLDPVVIEEIRVEPTTFGAVEAAGARIDQVTIPGFVIPGYTIDPGCIIAQQAPPGCAGGVTITGFEIPGVRIPEVTVPERTLPDGTVQPARTVPGAESQGVVVPSETVEPACQVVEREAKLAASRLAVSRRAASRAAISREATSQPAQNVTIEGSDESLYTPSRFLPSVYVPSVYVPSEYAPSEYLPYATLAGEPEVGVAQGEDTRAYVAPSEVLFDENRSVLKPAAQKALRSIVDDIDQLSPKGRIAVDGYTDNQGSAESGLTLSKARAAAVAKWLTGSGGIPMSRIAATHGYGEANPAAPNTTEVNMAKNRRVVISVER